MGLLLEEARAMVGLEFGNKKSHRYIDLQQSDYWVQQIVLPGRRQGYVQSAGKCQWLVRGRRIESLFRKYGTFD